MKILVITPFYYIEGRTDLKHDTNAIHYFAKYWSDSNEVKVFNLYPHSYKEILRYCSRENRKFYRESYVFTEDNIEVCLTEVQKYPGQKGKYVLGQIRHIVKQFKQWVKENSFIPDVIIVHVPSYAYTFMNELTDYLGEDIPVLGILHKTDIEELEYNRRLKRRLEKDFDAIYARSHGIKRKIALYNLANLKEEIIQSGIPLNESMKYAAPYSIQGELKLVYVGKLIPLKHVDAVIKAIAKINSVDIQLNIVGAGSEEQKLRVLVNNLGLEKEVSFIGTINRDKVFEYMAKANIFCMPSFPETLGLTYLEAMSVGCVPIGTKNEGIDGIIVDGLNGYLVDPENIEDSLVKKIQIYLELNDCERKKMSEKARMSVKELDESTCATNYLKIIKRSLGDG